MAVPEQSTSVEPSVAPEFYIWTFPGAPVRIHLYLNAVERLSREARRAFESIPSHSVEIGGLLLGTADFHAGPIIEVKDFEPFLCEYRPDHKFILSEPDRRKLEKVMEARKSPLDERLAVVGFYRSHIGENLSMSEQDLSIAQAYFYDPANVFLLVRPLPDGSLTAGFFFWDNGRIDSEFTFLEFPFDAHLLTASPAKPSPLDAAGSPPIDEPDVQPPAKEPDVQPPAGEPAVLPLAEEQDVQPPAEPRPIALPALFEEALGGLEKPARGRLRWLWYPLIAALMVALGAVAYPVYLQWLMPRPLLPARAVSDAPVLALQVERHNNDLRVSWNRNSPAVRNATEAVLSIRDGDAQLQDLQLDPDQLRNGSVLYTPANTTVQFRLSVSAADGQKLSETVLALTSAAPGIVARNAIPAPQLSQPLTNRTAAGSSPPSAGSHDLGEPVRVVLVDPPQQPGGGSLQTPALEQGSPQAKPGAPPEASDTQLPPPSSYVNARPVRQSQPVLPPNIRALVTSEVEVQIRVQIDASGRVTKADPMASTGPVTSSLVTAARNAALLWRFSPATRDGQPVASVMLLKFQYHPVRPVN